MSTYKIKKFDKKIQALYSLQELFLYLTVKLPNIAGYLKKEI